VPRPRLVSLVAPPGVRATLVIGPAGSGKTTLVDQWLATTHLPAAWVEVSPVMAPFQFWRLLVDGLASIDPLLGLEARDRLDLGDAPDQAMVGSLTADLETGGTGPVAVVVDDLHAAPDGRVAEQLRWLLDRCPPGLQVVVCSREEPPWPIARWRARGEIAEIRWDDLRLTDDEADSCLEQAGLGGLPEAERARLLSRTDGWAAGLALAAVALRRRDDPSSYLNRFDGTEHSIADFLVSEVLDAQPDDVRRFLLTTSVLERLTGPLCDALTGTGGGALMLTRLAKAGLFLEALDPAGEWYRYHHLFADVLRAELERERPGERTELTRRASLWFLEAGLADEALRHAAAADDPITS
jgi:LuxR family transcriptional regulator, maltose regulon positive regulatory protein